MNFKIVGAFAAVALLAACSHKPVDNGGAVVTPPTTTTTTTGIVPGSQEDLVANVGDRVFFALNKSTLSEDAQKTLGKQADFLAKYPADKIQIAGNADERGTEEYNRALGERRALAAREALAKLGVSPDRIRTISYGKDKPADPGHDESAWGKNRRDDFILLHPKAGV